MSGLIEFLRCRALQGDLRKRRAGAVDELFELLADPLYHYALSITRQISSAEEVLQDVFMQLVRDPDRLERVRDIKSYLFRSVRNRAYNHERDGVREVPVEPSELFEHPDGSLDHGEAIAVQQMLAFLPDEQREVLVLKIWEGLTFREIGEILEISANTAASRYRYGLQHLKTLLAGEPPGVEICVTT